MNLADLKSKSTEDLAGLAAELTVQGAGSMRRQELIFAILKAQGERKVEIRADGVLEILPDGFGFLRAPDSNYSSGPEDIYVSPSQIRRFELRTGDAVSGVVRPPKENERYFALLRVERVNGARPEQGAGGSKRLFENLTPVHPTERLALEHDPAALATRLVDLLCPLAKGHRCLVVAPPRAGASALLEEAARAIGTNHPDVDLIALLVDERPEEVTHFQRVVKGEVVSSTFDEPAARHVQVAEIVIEKAKRLAEQKRDVVILLDSLTRLARAYHAVAAGAASAPAAAGGIDPGALHKAKRVFGAGRKLEEGGSVTLVATASTGTGSAVDQAILEELSGTETAAIHLDRRLLEQRLFPCIDPLRSGARREDLLLSAEVRERIALLRAALQPLAADEAMRLLLEKLTSSASNQELLGAIGGPGLPAASR